MHLEKCKRENGTFESCPYCTLSFSYLCPLAQRMHVKQCGIDEDMIVRSPSSSPASNGQKRMRKSSATTTTSSDVLNLLSPEPCSNNMHDESQRRGPASAMAIRMSQQLSIGTSDEDVDENQVLKPVMPRNSEKVLSPRSKETPPAHRKATVSDARRANRASPKQGTPAKRVGSAQAGKKKSTSSEPAAGECHPHATETSSTRPKGTKRKRSEPSSSKSHITESSAPATSTTSASHEAAEGMPDYDSMDIDELKRIASGFGLKVGLGMGQNPFAGTLCKLAFLFDHT
jgi:hypothetical protein